jgi:peroxiredoxin
MRMPHFALAAAMLSASLMAGDLAVGSKVPAFQLKDTSGKAVAVTPGAELTVVTFISTKCPISNDYNDRMTAVYNDYSKKGVKFLFVNANSTEPAAEILEHIKTAGFPFAVHKDDTAADTFGAMVTPESFVIGKDGQLKYHGYIDDSRNTARVQDQGLRNALDAVMAGKAVANPNTKAFGCTIKRARKS